ANLLGNAIKYGGYGQPVTVRVCREEEDTGPVASIAVIDHGVGIPTADLPRIFERFYRAANVVGHIRGTGIGLAVARQIVEQHRGRISVESEEGVGSTFIVRLPLTGP
ncbi:MAG: sensor histidine kinase, partial [Chloroflexota bacterium]